MRRLTQKELNEILDNHELWLKTNGEQGEKADLSDKDLRYLYLSGRDLRRADFRNSDLRDTNFRGTKINNETDLRHTVITGLKGQQTITVLIASSFWFIEHKIVNYWIDLDIVTFADFQGTLDDVKEQVNSKYSDNEVLRKRYNRAITFIGEVAEDYQENLI